MSSVSHCTVCCRWEAVICLPPVTCCVFINKIKASPKEKKCCSNLSNRRIRWKRSNLHRTFSLKAEKQQKHFLPDFCSALQSRLWPPPLALCFDTPGERFLLRVHTQTISECKTGGAAALLQTWPLCVSWQKKTQCSHKVTARESKVGARLRLEIYKRIAKKPNRNTRGKTIEDDYTENVWIYKYSICGKNTEKSLALWIIQLLV